MSETTLSLGDMSGIDARRIIAARHGMSLDEMILLRERLAGWLLNNLSQATLNFMAAHWCMTSLRSCPAKAEYEARVEKPDTTAMALGSAFHLLLLEPQRWESDIVEIAFDDYRSKAAREARDEAVAAGKIPLKTSEVRTLQAMVKGAMDNRDVCGLLDSGGMAEASFLATDPEAGLLKARPDLTIMHENALVDVKTCPSAHPRAFERHAAWQLRVVGLAAGVRPQRYFYIAIEREPPYLSSVLELDRKALEQGETLCDIALQAWCEGRHSGRFSGYRNGVISLPSYLLYELGENDPSAVFQRSLAPTPKAPTPEQIAASIAWQAPVEEAI